MPRLFKASLFGYNRREVESSVELLGESLNKIQARLAQAEATLASRDAELHRRGERIEDLEKVSSLLAEYVVERDRRLRELREAVAHERQDRKKLAAALESERKRARESARANRLRKQQDETPDDLLRTASG